MPACISTHSAAWVPPTVLISRSVLELRTSVRTRVMDACFGIFGYAQEAREIMAMRFYTLLAHGIYDIVLNMYPDVSWCKRRLAGQVLETD